VNSGPRQYCANLKRKRKKTVRSIRGTEYKSLIKEMEKALVRDYGQEWFDGLGKK
jgi:hypothetical protein